jgi:3-oxoacyl-[acyl-carrier protein] reductase
VGIRRRCGSALAPAGQTPGADRLRELLGPAAAEFIDEQIKSTIPLGGALGDPVDDLGPTLMFLCSSGSRFITGQLIAVDGGLVMLGA